MENFVYEFSKLCLYSKVDWLPDKSGKPGEAFVQWFCAVLAAFSRKDAHKVLLLTAPFNSAPSPVESPQEKELHLTVDRRP